MEDKNKNPMENSENSSAGPLPPTPNQSMPENNPSPTPQPIPNAPSSPTPSMPTPPDQHSGGKGSTIIVGGILLLFIIIVVSLYFLILRQSYEPEVRITPPPIQQNEAPTEASPSAANAEEQEVIDINIEENLDEEFVPIDTDLNSL